MACVYGNPSKPEGVIIGADSRTSTGQYIANRVSSKVTELTDRIFVARSGSAADTQVRCVGGRAHPTPLPAPARSPPLQPPPPPPQALADYVRRWTTEHALDKGAPPSVQVVSKLFRSIAYANKDSLSAGLIIGGWDAEQGGSVYEVPLGGSCVRQPFSIGGSGSTYIYGLVDATYKAGMSKSEALAFVRGSISHAMARDGSSGGVIRTVTIDATGAVQEYVPGDKLPFMLA